MRMRFLVFCAALALLGGCQWRFARGPYVMSMADGKVEVLFRLRPGAALPEGAVVEILDDAGAVLASAAPTATAAGTYIAAMELPDPVRAARYRLAAAGKAVSKEYALTLPRPDGPTRLVVYGDTRTYPDDHRAVALAIAREKGVQAIFHVGDFASDGTVEALWDREFFAPARDALAGCPLFPVLGNHEKRGQPYFDAFGMDPKGGYYARRIGRAQFFVLDQYQAWQPGSSQHDWLGRELAAVPEGVYKIVVMHEPPFSAYERRGHSLPLVRGLGDLFARNVVDLVLCGHDHHYVRSRIIGPTAGEPGATFIVCGGGGAPRYAPTPDEWTAAVSEDLHYLVLEISADGRLSVSARGTDGVEFDRCELARPAAQAAELASGPMVAKQMVQQDLEQAFQNTFLIDRELAPGQAVSADITVPLSNFSEVPVEVSLTVEPGAWQVEVSPERLTLAPASAEEATIKVGHDGKGALYPTPLARCQWSVGGRPGKDIEVALFLSVAPTGTLTGVEDALVLDGMLTERFWNDLPKLGYLLREDGKGLATKGTDIYVAAGPDALYVAADCREDQMDSVRAKAKGYDDPNLWADDCVELFIEPVKGSGLYYQLVVSITGYRYDAKGKDASWNTKWEAVVAREQDGWAFEARIPWSSLGLTGRPKAGTEIGFNLGRTRNAVKELSQWSRIPSGDSHTPEKFGTLVVR